MNSSVHDARESVFGVWRAMIFFSEIFFSSTCGGSGAKHVLSPSSTDETSKRGGKCVELFLRDVVSVYLQFSFVGLFFHFDRFPS